MAPPWAWPQRVLRSSPSGSWGYPGRTPTSDSHDPAHGGRGIAVRAADRLRATGRDHPRGSHHPVGRRHPRSRTTVNRPVPEHGALAHGRQVARAGPGRKAGGTHRTATPATAQGTRPSAAHAPRTPAPPETATCGSPPTAPSASASAGGSTPASPRARPSRAPSAAAHTASLDLGSQHPAAPARACRMRASIASTSAVLPTPASPDSSTTPPGSGKAGQGVLQNGALLNPDAQGRHHPTSQDCTAASRRRPPPLARQRQPFARAQSPNNTLPRLYRR